MFRHSLCAAVGVLNLGLLSSAHADNGRSFTLVATEENTKDMSVNLVADTLRDDRIGPDGKYVPFKFIGRNIDAPSMAISKEEAIKLVNHDSGILDIQHTVLRLAPLASRILISFESLKDELIKNCWTAEDAPNLTAKLRLYVIPPYGPGKHNRWYGVSPTTHFTPAVGLDPPPARVPLAVFEQQKPWVEGDGQNSFMHTVTYDPAHLLDISTVGVSKAGTSWEGINLKPVDLCLNRKPGKVAIGDRGNRAELCYNPDPNWEPWMEWDVTKAVQKWLKNGFDPASYHGFSLYQYPADTVSDQVRFAPEEPGKARTRAVVSFASSSGKADCAGVGGLFGGPSQAEVIFGNGKCQSADPNDLVSITLRPGEEPTMIPRILEMKTHPEWAPQLVITASGPSRTCSARADFLPASPDLSDKGPTELKFDFRPLRAEDTLRVQKVYVRPSPGITVRGLERGCQGAVLKSGQPCIESFRAEGSAGQSKGSVEVQIDYLLNEETGPIRSLTKRQEVTISQDFDQTPDAIEDLAPNQDANEDQVPDRTQSHVNSVQDPRGGWLSVITESGLVIERLSFPDLGVNEVPGAVEFKRGFLGFTIKGLATPGQAVRVQVRAEQPFEEFSEFWGYGPTPKNFQPHWFGYGDEKIYGSKVKDGKLEMLLHDGALGDVDGRANGEIVVLGGAALAVGAAKKIPRLTDATVASSDPLLLFILGALGLGGLFFQTTSSRHQDQDLPR